VSPDPESKRYGPKRRRRRSIATVMSWSYLARCSGWSSDSEASPTSGRRASGRSYISEERRQSSLAPLVRGPSILEHVVRDCHDASYQCVQLFHRSEAIWSGEMVFRWASVRESPLTRRHGKGQHAGVVVLVEPPKRRRCRGVEMRCRLLVAAVSGVLALTASGCRDSEGERREVAPDVPTLAAAANDASTLRGKALAGNSGLRLVVADSRPFVLDVDSGRVTPVRGVDVQKRGTLSVVSVGGRAAVVAARGAWLRADLYGVRGRLGRASRLGTGADVVPATGGESIWVKNFAARLDARSGNCGLTAAWSPLPGRFRADQRSTLVVS
jgi:hypothetical protein